MWIMFLTLGFRLCVLYPGHSLTSTTYLKAQVNNNLVKLPENEGQTVSFGTKDTTIERVK